MTPAEIARGLTKAQRETLHAIVSIDGWPEARIRAMLDGTGKHGLLDLRDMGLAIKGPPWALTPLGLAVRRAILEEEGADG
jgi:hypothetical protein